MFRIQKLSCKYLIHTGRRLGYVGAAGMINSPAVRLPSNVLLDDYLVRSDKWKEASAPCSCWAREMLVYVGKGERIRKGRDIHDDETGWVLPAGFIPESAEGKRMLLVDPAGLDVKNSRVAVIPGKVISLANMVEDFGSMGRMDEKTRLPLRHKIYDFSGPDLRWLIRGHGTAVRPIARKIGKEGEGRRAINAVTSPETPLDVLLAVPAEQEPGALIRDAEASLQELSDIIGSEKLEAFRRLIRALD
ncbi:hypothetical protein GF318_05710 [Candidatus Micrarchaeota archaeon]|nr:hypothetical protein [Candidatus Micrarchaeota archaeon]